MTQKVKSRISLIPMFNVKGGKGRAFMARPKCMVSITHALLCHAKY